MPTQIKEVIVTTRNSTDTPFFPVDSVFWFDTDPKECKAAQYFTENYANTGKGVQSSIHISNDGLIMANEVIYNDALYIKEIYEDQYYKNDGKIRGEHNRANGIFVQEHYYSMDTNNPINIRSLF